MAVPEVPPMIASLFLAGVLFGVIRQAMRDDWPANTRTCDRCGLTVTGPRVYPRCPSCGAGLDVRAA